MISTHKKPGGKCEGWLNIYRLESAQFIVQTSLHTTEADAIRKAKIMDETPNDHRWVARIKIEWQENEAMQAL